METEQEIEKQLGNAIATSCTIIARMMRCLTCSALLNVPQRKHLIVTLTVHDVRVVALTSAVSHDTNYYIKTNSLTSLSSSRVGAARSVSACILLHGLRSQLTELLGYVTACALRYKCVDENKQIAIAWMNDPS